MQESFYTIASWVLCSLPVMADEKAKGTSLVDQASVVCSDLFLLKDPEQAALLISHIPTKRDGARFLEKVAQQVFRWGNPANLPSVRSMRALQANHLREQMYSIIFPTAGLSFEKALRSMNPRRSLCDNLPYAHLCLCTTAPEAVCYLRHLPKHVIRDIAKHLCPLKLPNTGDQQAIFQSLFPDTPRRFQDMLGDIRNAESARQLIQLLEEKMPIETLLDFDDLAVNTLFTAMVKVHKDGPQGGTRIPPNGAHEIHQRHHVPFVHFHGQSSLKNVNSAEKRQLLGALISKKRLVETKVTANDIPAPPSSVASTIMCKGIPYVVPVEGPLDRMCVKWTFIVPRPNQGVWRTYIPKDRLEAFLQGESLLGSPSSTPSEVLIFRKAMRERPSKSETSTTDAVDGHLYTCRFGRSHEKVRNHMKDWNPKKSSKESNLPESSNHVSERVRKKTNSFKGISKGKPENLNEKKTGLVIGSAKTRQTVYTEGESSSQCGCTASIRVSQWFYLPMWTPVSSSSHGCTHITERFHISTPVVAVSISNFEHHGHCVALCPTPCPTHANSISKSEVLWACHLNGKYKSPPDSTQKLFLQLEIGRNPNVSNEDLKRMWSAERSDVADAPGFDPTTGARQGHWTLDDVLTRDTIKTTRRLIASETWMQDKSQLASLEQWISNNEDKVLYYQKPCIKLCATCHPGCENPAIFGPPLAKPKISKAKNYPKSSRLLPKPAVPTSKDVHRCYQHSIPGDVRLSMKPVMVNFFALCIQTPAMFHSLKEANDTLLLDSTYGTNQLGYELFTLTGIDRYQYGFVAAHAILQSAVHTEIGKFLEKVRETFMRHLAKSGILQWTPTFILDLNVAEANAIIHAFGEEYSRSRIIYCSWHVTRNWIKKAWELFPKVVVGYKRSECIHELLNVLYHSVAEEYATQCTAEDLLDTWLNKWIAEEQVGFKKFAEYIEDNYSDNLARWARSKMNYEHADQFTNNLLERWHLKLKQDIKWKCNGRLDWLVHKLCGMAGTE